MFLVTEAVPISLTTVIVSHDPVVTRYADRVVAIVSPNSAPMKRLKDEAKEDKRLIDATHGRRTRSMIVMDSNHIVLSAIQAETVSQRYAMLKELT